MQTAVRVPWERAPWSSPAPPASGHATQLDMPRRRGEDGVAGVPGTQAREGRLWKAGGRDCSSEVDDKVEAHGLLHWPAGRRGPFEDLVDIDGRPPGHRAIVRPIAHE